MMINSEHFGMTFWLDDDNEFRYCPTFINNEPDKSYSGYVVEWDDWEGVDYNELFAIHRKLVLFKWCNEDNNNTAYATKERLRNNLSYNPSN